MGCIMAPDRNLEIGQRGTHEWILFDERIDQPMNPGDIRRLPSWAIREWGTNLYRCKYCGEIEPK